MHVASQKEEFYVVEVTKDEVRQAIIEVAKRELTRHYQHHPGKNPDLIFEPQVISDGYSGFKVYFKAGTPVENPVAKFVSSCTGVNVGG